MQERLLVLKRQLERIPQSNKIWNLRKPMKRTWGTLEHYKRQTYKLWVSKKRNPVKGIRIFSMESPKRAYFSSLEREGLSGDKGHTEHQVDRPRKQPFPPQGICISIFWNARNNYHFNKLKLQWGNKDDYMSSSVCVLLFLTVVPQYDDVIHTYSRATLFSYIFVEMSLQK